MWAYSGLALETRTSADYRYVKGQLQRSRKQISIRGLNKDHDHDLKGLFKAAATMAQCTARAVPRVLRELAGQRDQANHGASLTGA
jgi:hypothetical protein